MGIRRLGKASGMDGLQELVDEMDNLLLHVRCTLLHTLLHTCCTPLHTGFTPCFDPCSAPAFYLLSPAIAPAKMSWTKWTAVAAGAWHLVCTCTTQASTPTGAPCLHLHRTGFNPCRRWAVCMRVVRCQAPGTLSALASHEALGASPAPASGLHLHHACTCIKPALASGLHLHQACTCIRAAPASNLYLHPAPPRSLHLHQPPPAAAFTCDSLRLVSTGIAQAFRPVRSMCRA